MVRGRICLEDLYRRGEQHEATVQRAYIGATRPLAWSGRWVGGGHPITRGLGEPVCRDGCEPGQAEANAGWRMSEPTYDQRSSSAHARSPDEARGDRGRPWESILTAENGRARGSEAEAVMRTDRGEHPRRQRSQATCAQTGAEARDCRSGTGGRVEREEKAWRRGTRHGPSEKEARQPRVDSSATPETAHRRL